MTVGLLPDAELVVSHFLRERTDVTDLCPRIGTRNPPTLDDPWVRITLIGDRPIGTAAWFVIATVQIDCYAGKTGTQEQASELARVVREALDSGLPGQQLDAVVTYVQTNQRRQPDLEPAVERYIVSAQIGLHP